MVQIVENIQKSNDRPGDPRNQEMVHAPFGDFQIGNLATPINSSAFTKAYINNLPAYRRGLSPQRRGLEVGLAHGYWLLGPFATLNPLRETEVGLMVGLFATISILIISTLAISLYATVNPPSPIATVTTPNPPEELKTAEGWHEYAGGFLIGGVGGALVAYALLANLDVVKTMFNII